ncbi:hypothetical protein AAG906_032235 [Vitis piasezkii]
MTKVNFLDHHFACLIATILVLTMGANATDDGRKVYIVYLGSLPQGEFSPLSQHLNILEDVLEGSSSRDSLVRSYKRSFNGFAAKLTEKEREKLCNKDGVVSIFPSNLLQLQTTRSWDFMGLSETIERKPAVESDVIVGVIDTGIWPESPSFSDEGFGPPPKKWKGVCSGGKNFTCNKKVIGAQLYNSLNDPDDSVRDRDGHGSHTASTAAGNKIKGASFYGVAEGSARGGVPSARIAVYKVCFQSGCADADVLAAFDDAISDGVDIISVSLGKGSAPNLNEDSLAIGSFHAMAKGILTLNSAGNGGPNTYSVGSVAPWMVSVAASTTDRQIITKVVLGNGTTLAGSSINTFVLNGTEFPLVYGKDATRTCDEYEAQLCSGDCLERSLVEGKIILCRSITGDRDAHEAGAVGSISQEFDVPSIVPFPISTLNEEEFRMIETYYISTKNPQANILKSESTKDSSAPVVASFSSRGPNTIIPEILKPDITAPGVDILAAYSPVAPVTDEAEDKRSVKYTILSGTSMSCPHVAGIAAYIKTFHPDWSPSAIQSALITTAWPMNGTTYDDGELAFGSGHVDPVKAVSPGLVYEALKADYINMMCSMGYDTKTVRLVSGDNSSCPKDTKGSPKDLNYPSMAVKVEETKSFKVEFPRTVTNFGSANSTYKATVINTNSHIKVQVNPDILSFKLEKEKKSFVVTVVGQGLDSFEAPIAAASLVWSDGTHSVRSPIVAYIDRNIG